MFCGSPQAAHSVSWDKLDFTDVHGEMDAWYFKLHLILSTLPTLVRSDLTPLEWAPNVSGLEPPAVLRAKVVVSDTISHACAVRWRGQIE